MTTDSTRYVATGPDRLWDVVDNCYFITERMAMERLNAALESAALIVEAAEDVMRCGSYAGDRVRALKENL